MIELLNRSLEAMSDLQPKGGPFCLLHEGTTIVHSQFVQYLKIGPVWESA